jgi:hypothetical protein
MLKWLGIIALSLSLVALRNAYVDEVARELQNEIARLTLGSYRDPSNWQETLWILGVLNAVALFAVIRSLPPQRVGAKVVVVDDQPPPFVG